MITTNKKAIFDPADQELADWAKALSHPARIAILKELARRNTCICGEIVEVLPLAQSTVSQHLKELARVGLILGSAEGVKSCYCINRTAFARLQAHLGQLLQELLAPDCC